MPCLYHAGNFTTIDVPGAIWTLPYSINDHSDIVEEFYTSNPDGPLIRDQARRGPVVSGVSSAPLMR
jgi:hypothetical protein